ncbi:glycosyltransferase [Pseudoxanthomonas wuyuanensis]|uniref:Glycosyltransferase, GT2 family n=1 Tax=Pseudoxanthomonas wuyuanensis TaxID=1073196 RepID=A0A286D7W4_9GAMM|nr:glycosyltransferase [Pseudoxanthomonas wuyuanensis]KAF1720347.1 glycosyl transferase [Pseudoxanthomonas wuyuanensis]SOD54729.1 Glycosyltransferase, GT2 family [Pseudoxanthomonas wuyuanensis]
MSFSLSDARFLFHRALGLFRRGLASLRTRGWRSSWERVKFQFRRAPRIRRQSLYFPAEAALAPFAVPASDTPRASIVIPVYGQLAHTVNCLRALAAHPPQAACEVIVVDDGSPDQTAQWMPQIAGLRYHRRAHNGGFIAACNDGAAMAEGEYLVFLNNDTIPQPGWLDALLSTFASHPEAGLVGAQLLYPDGRLQEAGGVVFADGSAWNYGRLEAPEDPRFASLRDADYCSGAALAIPRDLFQAVGGFDTRYAPAYYEDTDLAFSVRARGRRVLYQPAARVVHLEGITSGTDTHSGIKAYQVRNREIFAQKWRERLRTQPGSDQIPTPSVLHRGQRQVLLIDALTPQPDRDSGSLRLVNLMRLLLQEGAHVVFVPALGRHDGAYTESLQRLGIEVWYAPFRRRFPAWLHEHGARFDTVVLCRHYVASEFVPLVRRHLPAARIVFDTIDLHYLRETRGADIDGDSALRLAALKTRRRELALIEASDITLVVSTAEQALLAKDAPQARVEVLSNLHEIAGGGQPFAQRRDLVFVGGFRHPPNVDAVRWFVDAVFPLIRAQLPEVEFYCIGSDPPAPVAALGQRPGVRIHGYVPDIAPYMDGCRVALAPLRFGAGVKGKINLSMAHGQPVVATSCAVEGMHLRDGWDVLVADDPAAYAAAVVDLYRDEARWNRLAANGLDNVRHHFSLEAARATVRRVFFA